MRFKRNLQYESGWGGLSFVPFLAVMFLLLIFIMIGPSLQIQPGIWVGLPKAVTSEGVGNQQIVLTISAEHILYFDNRPQTPDQIQKLLQAAAQKQGSLLVKADAACPLEYTVNLLDAARKAGIQKIAVATN